VGSSRMEAIDTTHSGQILQKPVRAAINSRRRHSAIVVKRLHPRAEHVIDWFHIPMRFTLLKQMAKGISVPDANPKHNDRAFRNNIRNLASASQVVVEQQT
jgi:hypothetical protein